jgi:hypothetical protein
LHGKSAKSLLSFLKPQLFSKALYLIECRGEVKWELKFPYFFHCRNKIYTNNFVAGNQFGKIAQVTGRQAQSWWVKSIIQTNV